MGNKEPPQPCSLEVDNENWPLTGWERKKFHSSFGLVVHSINYRTRLPVPGFYRATHETVVKEIMSFWHKETLWETFFRQLHSMKDPRKEEILSY